MQKHYKSKNKTKKHPKHFYKMRGCSKKSMCSKKHGGGYLGDKSQTVGADLNLAYSYNGPVVRNDALAYTGKGGYRAMNAFSSTPAVLQGGESTVNSNVNGVNPLYPNTGPPANGYNFLNPVNQQQGGSCGCGMPSLMSGGRKGHRSHCKCSTCKGNKKYKMGGGAGCSTSNNGIPYPNGLVGSPYNNPTNLPGANGIPGDANYYSNNTYNNDVSRQMVNVGANPPFLSLKGGRKGKNKTRKMRGGNLSNFFMQDLVNLGRQFTHGVGTAFNGLNGYPAPQNPLPWKGQLAVKQ